MDKYISMMYHRGMKRITVFISQPQFAALKRLAQAQGISFAEVLRRALDAFLRQSG
jgi:predicted DNA binding CopG/RHH family protein